MGRKNPIVGLAYVVTSQQEMLEAAKEQYNELLKKYNKLEAQRYGKNKIEQLEAEKENLSEELEGVKISCEEVSRYLEESKLNYKELQAAYEHERIENSTLKAQLKGGEFYWEPWDPAKEYPLDLYGQVPQIVCLALYGEESKKTVWDARHNAERSLAGKYGLCQPATERSIDRDTFRIRPFSDEVRIIAVNVRYWDKYMCLDELPELMTK